MLALALLGILRRLGINTDWMPRMCGKIGAFASVSAIGYLLVTVPLLGHAPAVVLGVRTAVIALAALIMLRRNGFTLSHEPDEMACALTGFGLVWIELTELDEHVFGVLTLSTPFGHLAFHGLGQSPRPSQASNCGPPLLSTVTGSPGLAMLCIHLAFSTDMFRQPWLTLRWPWSATDHGAEW
jgi:hypothetical protein